MCQLISFFGQDDSDILPYFIEHYRSLGVEKFHIFIHGDWTQADLAPLKGDDTVIAGIVQSPFDIVMKSAALQAHAKGMQGEWLLLVDADEFLEVPYDSLAKTIEALGRIGIDELPALLMQRAAADGSLPSLDGDVPLDRLFPSYDYRLADRVDVPYPVWKNKYPLVRVGLRFHVSRGYHLPFTRRPSVHIPIRGILHHFKWRDRLLRSVTRVRGKGSNQLEQNAYLHWLERHDFHLPTDGLRPYSRAALFKAGYLMRPNPAEMARLVALRKVKEAPPPGRKAPTMPRVLTAVPPAAPQSDDRAAAYLDRLGLSVMPARIALVTSDILGLRRSGGIGTAIAALAERLSAAGHEVHVFLSPYSDFPTPHPTWIEYWEARGVRIHYFPRQGPRGRILSAQDMSLVLCAALAETDWDVIHFPDAGGMATATLLQRAAGLAFQSTRIVVTVHGPTRWHRGGNFLPWTGYEAELSEIEGLSIQLADVLVFPSAYMLEWTRRHFPSKAVQLVIPNSLTGESRRFGRFSLARRRVEKVVFFGRIEIRKGVDVFISAIETVLASGSCDFEAVFLGSIGQRFSEADLQRRIEHWPCRKRLLLNYTTHDAVDLLRTENCLVVIPSRVDNSPYTVYECLENAIPFITSTVGGIPGLMREEDRPRVLVGGDADDYAAKILDAVRNGVVPARPSFDPDQADLDLLSLHGRLAEEARSLRGRESVEAAPRASVIIYGEEQPSPALAEVLQHWRQEGAELLWAGGDGATSIGAGASLNRLARSAIGEYLLFCHLSVTPRTDLLDAMLTAASRMQTGAIVCGYQNVDENGETGVVPVFAGPPELSASRNVYGARLFLVRKDALRELGGFSTEAEIAPILEWEFLNRLKASGRQVLAIPAAMASVAKPPRRELNEYQAGRLAAPWTASLSEPLVGFVRMALHPELKPEQRGKPSANLTKAVDGGLAIPDVRGLDLETLLARHARTDRSPAGRAVALQRPAVPADLSSALPAGIGSSSAHLLAVEDGVLPAALDDGGGHPRIEGIGADGRLVDASSTYVIGSAADADGCDFLVAENVIDVRTCRLLAKTFQAMETRIAEGSKPSRAPNVFFRFDEVLAAHPSAAASILDAVRQAIDLTVSFYGLTAPLYPTSVTIERIGEGTFALPRPAIATPRIEGIDPPGQDLVGRICLNDDVDGGEVYFTSLDIAVAPRRGSYIGRTASEYHETALLRVASGGLLSVSFLMRASRDDMSPGLQQFY